MKRIGFLLALSFLVLTSCNTQTRAISQLRSLTNEIETNGQYYDKSDWEAVYADYEEINGRINQQKLTTEQRKELGQLKGRCVASFLKSAAQTVKNAITEGSGILEGIINGLTK